MITRFLLAQAYLIGSLVLASPAGADPCTAPLPSRSGERFGGEGRYIGDGASRALGSASVSCT